LTHRAFQPLLLDLLRQAQSRQNAFFLQRPPAELAVIGTPACWSARDHVAHLTFWRQRLVLHLQAILQQQVSAMPDEVEQLNLMVFQRYRSHPWLDILSASDHAYGELLALTAHLREDDLVTDTGLNWLPAGATLSDAFMGYCYEHTQQHLAQYLLDRHKLTGALEIYESWASLVCEAAAPERLQGSLLYNLACFYATHDRQELARPFLQQAFTLLPETRTLALRDPDLIAFRPSSSGSGQSE
jgi:hypothetical protein